MSVEQEKMYYEVHYTLPGSSVGHKVVFEKQSEAEVYLTELRGKHDERLHARLFRAIYVQ